jgi:hypothetical protein
METGVLECAQRFADGRAEAEKTLLFADFVEMSYSEEAVYKAAYGGVLEVVAKGRGEILATHYGRDMELGWQGWTWPCRGVFVSPEGGAIVHWVNLAPFSRADGSPYETPGVSFLEFDEAGSVLFQSDVMDLGAQLGLCEELDREGLLNGALKASWVTPMKKMMVDALS